MRRIELTFEQIETIENAMRVAERTYNELYEQAVKVDGGSEATKKYFNTANDINDLRRAIGNGELDV